MELGLDALRAGIAIAMLAGATILDLRTRRVPNRYWYPFVGAAAVLLVVDLALAATHDRRDLLVVDAVGLLLCGFFYLLWRTGFLFGGADAKALMLIAILWPQPLATTTPVPPALGTLMLASVVMLLVPIGFLAWNVAHGQTRLPAALLGIRMDLADARLAKVWPMQDVAPDGRVRFRYWVKLRGDFDARYDALEAAGVTSIWTTPKVPFFVPLVLGAAAWLWVGQLPVPAALGP